MSFLLNLGDLPMTTPETGSGSHSDRWPLRIAAPVIVALSVLCWIGVWKLAVLLIRLL